MNIIMGHDHAASAREKYTVLELDTFIIDEASDTVTAFCLIEKLPIDQMSHVQNLCDLHDRLMQNYRKKNWTYCEDAIEHLRGCWGGELDSFYDDLQRRIKDLGTQDLDDSWDGIIIK